MNTPSWRQIIVTVIITSLLCLFPLLPAPILQQQTLHLLVCLPIMVWGIYFLTDKWFIDNNRKALHNSILWFISVLVIAGLSLTHYTYQVSDTYSFWQALAVVISCSLLSLRLLKELEKRAFEHENRLQALQEQMLPKPVLAEENISEQENIEIKEIVQVIDQFHIFDVMREKHSILYSNLFLEHLETQNWICVVTAVIGSGSLFLAAECVID